MILSAILARGQGVKRQRAKQCRRFCGQTTGSSQANAPEQAAVVELLSRYTNLPGGRGGVEWGKTSYDICTTFL